MVVAVVVGNVYFAVVVVTVWAAVVVVIGVAVGNVVAVPAIVLADAVVVGPDPAKRKVACRARVGANPAAVLRQDVCDSLQTRVFIFLRSGLCIPSSSRPKSILLSRSQRGRKVPRLYWPHEQ